MSQAYPMQDARAHPAVRMMIEQKLALLGDTLTSVQTFFRDNPDLLDGPRWKGPIWRFLRNVLGVDPIVGQDVLYCGEGVRIPLPPGVKAFVKWYDNCENEPDFESLEIAA